MPALDTPFRLPDGVPTDLKEGDEIAWDPNTHAVVISRLTHDGTRMDIRVHQADGSVVVETVLGDGPRDRFDGLTADHVQASIEFILDILGTPLTPRLLPQTNDRYVFRLE